MKAIVCVDSHNCIGLHNQLLVTGFKEDMKFFKEQTVGHPVIMGRKTFESIGRPLPLRKNLILTSNADKLNEQFKDNPDVEAFNDIYSMIDSMTDDEIEDAFVIGGSTIYNEMLPYVDTIFMTRMYACFNGDAFFPALSKDEWISDPYWLYPSMNRPMDGLEFRGFSHTLPYDSKYLRYKFTKLIRGQAGVDDKVDLGPTEHHDLDVE